MRIHTNAGEVELTADMVRPGMVFQSEHWRCADAPDGAMIMARPSGVWCGDERGWTSTTGCGVIASTGRLLGCDPAIAAREDVERYGVAPGIDAGAHGFARLRTGGAVDLRREVPIGAVVSHDGERHGPFAPGQKLPRWLDARLVGLDARYARPEDVERLCCGEHYTEQILDGYVGRTSTGDVCTLAIGDHDTHEDIATGVRWGLVLLTELLAGAATTIAAFRHGLDRCHDRGYWPRAVVATPWQISDLAQDARVDQYHLLDEWQTPRKAFEKGQRHEAIPGHRLVAVVCGVPLVCADP